jgi:hypothetical protein
MKYDGEIGSIVKIWIPRFLRLVQAFKRYYWGYTDTDSIATP